MASSLSQATLDAISAAVATAVATALSASPIVSAPAQPSVAASHFKARDLACSHKGCSFKGRTAKGLAFHVARTDAKAHAS